MPGITLGEIANEEIRDYGDDFPKTPTEFGDIEEKPSKFNAMFENVLTANTGEGSIGDYIDHPMNFNQSKGLAQLIRGLSGIIGNLDLAIVDVIFGALRFSKEKRGVINGVSISGGGDLPS